MRVTDNYEMPETCPKCGASCGEFGCKVEYCCGKPTCADCGGQEACKCAGACNAGEGEHLHACCASCGCCLGDMKCTSAMPAKQPL